MYVGMRKSSWRLAYLLVVCVTTACAEGGRKGSPVEATVTSSGNATASINAGEAEAEAFVDTQVEESLGLAWSLVEGEATVNGEGEGEAQTQTSALLEIDDDQQGTRLLVDTSTLAGFLTGEIGQVVGEVVVVDESLGDREKNLAENEHQADLSVESEGMLAAQIVHSSTSKRVPNVVLDGEDIGAVIEAIASLNGAVAVSDGRSNVVSNANTRVRNSRASTASEMQVVVSSRGRASAEAYSETLAEALDRFGAARRTTTGSGSASFSADGDVNGFIDVSSKNRANRNSDRAVVRARSVVSGKNAAASSSASSSSATRTK
ncbi:hypothetical protein BSKO_10526 [Bryopsis sp. KO-2023]|nr:hypothetical protein BSKO_10526 [Bryopsis sp. KO-2023]